MSECVVRMEMPEKCDECPVWCICGTLHKYMLGIDCDSDWTYDDLLVITVDGFVKPDNCPIICQLPEGHGRLIDADALHKIAWPVKDHTGRIEECVQMRDLYKAPTIVQETEATPCP